MSFQKELAMNMVDFNAYLNQTSGKRVPIVELMSQTNSIVQDIPFTECNDGTGHKTKLITGLPEVHWRKFNEGVPYSKGQSSMVRAVTGMLEARSIVDEKILELYKSKGQDENYRMMCAKGFIEAMHQEFARTIFYGDVDLEPYKFNGFHKYFGALSAPNVIDAGGVTSDGKLASIWFVNFGESTIQGIYPEGSVAGLSHKDLGVSTVQDDSGNSFEAVIDRYQWDVGLSISDWRSVVRVANIPVEKLSEDRDSDDYVNLQQLLIQAKNKMPENQRGKGVWYCNEDILTGIEMQSIDPRGVHLRYGEFFSSKDVPMVHGRPIRQVDALLSTESVLV